MFYFSLYQLGKKLRLIDLLGMNTLVRPLQSAVKAGSKHQLLSDHNCCEYKLLSTPPAKRRLGGGKVREGYRVDPCSLIFCFPENGKHFNQ